MRFSIRSSFIGNKNRPILRYLILGSHRGIGTIKRSKRSNKSGASRINNDNDSDIIFSY